jgi:hypothetical protein
LIGESVVLPVASDIIETTLGESYAKELRKIPLLDNHVVRSISDISEAYVIN